MNNGQVEQILGRNLLPKLIRFWFKNATTWNRFVPEGYSTHSSSRYNEFVDALLCGWWRQSGDGEDVSITVIMMAHWTVVGLKTCTPLWPLWVTWQPWAFSQWLFAVVLKNVIEIQEIFSRKRMICEKHTTGTITIFQSFRFTDFQKIVRFVRVVAFTYQYQTKAFIRLSKLDAFNRYTIANAIMEKHTNNRTQLLDNFNQD